MHSKRWVGLLFVVLGAACGNDAVDFSGFSTIEVDLITDRSKAEIEAKPGHDKQTVELVKASDDALKSLTKLSWIKKNKQGMHQYIPTSWVRTIDAKVHIDRTGD